MDKLFVPKAGWKGSVPPGLCAPGKERTPYTAPQDSESAASIAVNGKHGKIAESTHLVSSRSSQVTSHCWDKKTYLSINRIMLWVCCTLMLLGPSSAQAVDSNVHCDHIALAKMVSGFCVTEIPTGLCCMAIINVMDRGVKDPCLCLVIKAGIPAEELIRIYHLCGGKNPSAPHLPSLCEGAPPPPPEGNGGGSPPPPPSRATPVAITILACVVVVSSGWLLYYILKPKSVSQQSHANEIEMSVRNSDSLGEEVEVMPLQSRQQDEPPLDIPSKEQLSEGEKKQEN